jgi:hypothetical protein
MNPWYDGGQRLIRIAEHGDISLAWMLIGFKPVTSFEVCMRNMWYGIRSRWTSGVGDDW